MNRLKNYEKISYDSNIIIYYCLKTKETQIIEFTDKSHILTEFLVKNGSFIIVPNFIINEIKNIEIAKMIPKMISNKELTNIPEYKDYLFQYTLELKFKKKFKKMQEKEWFLIEVYFPTKEVYEKIEEFFKRLDRHPLVKQFLKEKHKTSVIPSFEDMGLIAYSKEKNYPIITNDKDLTFFAKEMFEKGVSGEIFALTDLDIYNN